MEGDIKLNDIKDYHILGPRYGPRMVPDALHILALIFRTTGSDIDCIYKRKNLD